MTFKFMRIWFGQDIFSEHATSWDKLYDCEGHLASFWSRIYLFIIVKILNITEIYLKMKQLGFAVQ